MNPKTKELLKNIPDLTSWEESRLFIETGKDLISEWTPQTIFNAEIASLDWSEIAEKRQLPFGLYASEAWRKFVLATFLADLASYPRAPDQVNFDRLLFVMHTFPEGFRTWWIKLSNNSWWPVGYSGWYPMFETTYEIFKKAPEKLRDRLVAPNTYSALEKPLLYLFNYSVAPILRKSTLSKSLMKRFIQDIQAQKASGLACITVSEDGIRVANSLGMSCSGYLNFDGDKEGVYTT